MKKLLFLYEKLDNYLCVSYLSKLLILRVFAANRLSACKYRSHREVFVILFHKAEPQNLLVVRWNSIPWK